jgi:hypothetical protein
MSDNKSEPSAQTTEITFMVSASLCFGISWVYLWKTRDQTTQTSTTIFLIEILILVIFGVIYYCLNKFGKVDDKIFNWVIIGISLGFFVIFSGTYAVGWWNNIRGSSSGSSQMY